jgi:hypothetical protein
MEQRHTRTMCIIYKAYFKPIFMMETETKFQAMGLKYLRSFKGRIRTDKIISKIFRIGSCNSSPRYWKTTDERNGNKLKAIIVSNATDWRL